jgi:hypothetical protein
MADVDYSVGVQFEGEGELRQAANAFDRMGDSAKRTFDDLNNGARGSGLGLLNLEAGISLAGQAFSTLQSVASSAFAALSEGAALVDARGDFEDLTAAIGGTADAMLGDLKAASGGMITDAQLIADASNLMALNLGLTKDQIVDFSGVAAELDWDMQKLADTLNTGSTRGLKEMGLSIDEVKGKMAELEAQGLSTDEAFRLAILEAAEEKIGRVGKKSEEAAGQLQILETSIANAQNAFKEAFAESLVGALGTATDNVQLLDRAIQETARSAGSLAGNLGSTAAFQFATDATEKRIAALGGGFEEINKQIAEMERRKGVNFFELGLDPVDAEIAAERYRIVADELLRLERIQTMIDAPIDFPGPTPKAIQQINYYTDALARFHEASNQGQGKSIISDLESGNWSYVQDVMGNVNEALLEQSRIAIKARDAWQEYTDAMTTRGGAIFADFLDEAGQARADGEAWGFDTGQAIYEAMRRGGAGVNPLSDFAASLGTVAEDIDAAINAMQQQAVIDNLAQAAIDGKLAWEDYAAAVENAFRILEGGYAIDLGARELPAPEDRGFRQGVQETLDSAIPAEPIVIEIDANTELAVAAVNEAKGLVDGFVNPSEAYKAVMDMDISSVESGAATATSLINGIPTSRTVTINWQQTGEDILAALRALGLLP